MRVSIAHSNPERLKDVSRRWIVSLLENEYLNSDEKPPSIKGYIYMDDVPKLLRGGAWEIGIEFVTLASPSSRPVDPLTKISIISAIANLTGILEEPAIIGGLTRHITKALTDSITNVYAGIVRSGAVPTHFALHPQTCTAALQRNNTWYLPSGAPVEVDNTWIIMDL